jgi:hypothetical protein
MRTVVLAALGGSILLACGGDVAFPLDGGPDASATDTGSTDGTLKQDGPTAQDGGVLPTACPSKPPVAGTACASVGETCEYGSAWWLFCDTVLKCGTDNLWVQTENGKGSCGTEDAGSCPATFASAKDAGVCTPGDCDYPEGHCTCLGYCGGPPPPGPTPNTFHCSPTPPTCPAPRPRGGTACATEGQVCSYALGCCGGTILTCKSGAWAAASPPICP